MAAKTQLLVDEANSPMNDAANRRVIEEAALATEREMIVSAETHIKRERIALEVRRRLTSYAVAR